MLHKIKHFLGLHKEITRERIMLGVLIKWIEYLIFLKETAEDSWASEKTNPTFKGFMDYTNTKL